MKAVATLFMTLLATEALATTCVQVIPDEAIRPDGSIDHDAMHRRYVRDHFERNQMVLEAKVSAIRQYQGHTVIDIAPVRYWKTDGSPAQHIFRPYSELRGPVLGCAPRVEVGSTYIMFGERATGVLSNVKVQSTPLVLREAYPTNEAIREYVGSLAILWIKMPTASPPNQALQRAGQP